MNKGKLGYLIVCEAINFIKAGEKEEKIVIQAPILNYVAPFLPTQLSFAVAGGVNNLDPNTSYNFDFSLKDPKGGIVFSQTGNFTATTHNGLPPNVSFALDLRNIILQYEGEYSANVHINNELLGKQVFNVFKETQR